MDLQTRKICFIQEFLRLENEEIISSLEQLMKERRSEVYKEALNPMSMDQLSEEINLAMEDSENERLIKGKDLKSKYKK